jgi:hypothetical protein
MEKIAGPSGRTVYGHSPAAIVGLSPTDCGVSLCVITNPLEYGGLSPCWAAEPEKIINKMWKRLPSSTNNFQFKDNTYKEHV